MTSDLDWVRAGDEPPASSPRRRDRPGPHRPPARRPVTARVPVEPAPADACPPARAAESGGHRGPVATVSGRNTAERTRSSDIDRCLHQAINELTTELGDRYGERRIRAEAERAVQDLRGSISIEALPEMVNRLVHVRIAEPSR